MKKVLSILFNPWVVGVLAFLAMAFVIWFFGPLLAFNERSFLEPESRRLILIALVALTMIGRALWKKLRADKASSEIVEGIVEPDEPVEADQGEEEVATLKGRFEDAVKLLKKSNSSGASLYEMPWYIIIGPPGSGKTTALVNSGLEFPLADQFGKEALQGVGGTRNCDWWFTDEAVLLDTAGRYTTQDSDASVDRTAWHGFLDLLKRHRKRRPINGVFVAISVQDLLTLNEAERSAHAAAIKSRIGELYEHFGIRFPVYVMMTKVDLISGFMEYFDDLGQADREQVWGFTLPLLDKDAEFDFDKAFGGEYDALVNRLNERLGQRMHQEQDLQRRSKIFGFPRQVASLKPAAQDFLMKIFKPSRYDDAFVWRGLYMTSGTQEGTPIDRLVGSLARTFGLEQQALASSGGQGRSYFIGDMMQKVAFTESELAGSNRKLEMQRAWLQRASYAAVFLLAIAAVVGWTVSFMQNRTLIASAQEQVNALQEAEAGLDARQTHPLDAVPLLNATALLPGGYASREESPPLTQRLGLYQGNRIGRASENTYTRLLGNEMLPRILLDQETQMRRGWDSPEMLFNALKAYLMLDDDDRFDPVFVRTIWKLMWEIDLPRDTTQEQFDELMMHASALTQNMPGSLPEPLDERLISSAQRAAQRLSPADRVYSRVRQRASQLEIEPFTIASAAGKDSAIVFRRKSGKALSVGIDGLYTYDGFHTAFEKFNTEESGDLDSDRWVLGDDALEEVNIDELESEVLSRYLSDYESNYADLLADLALVPPSDRSDAVEKLQILSDEKRSPLELLVNAVINEITLERDEDSASSKIASAARKARELERGLEDKIRSVTGRATPRLRGGVSLSPRERQLAGLGSTKLNKLKSMTTEEGDSSLFDDVIALLGELYTVLDDIDQASDPAKAAKQRSGEMQKIVAELSRKTRNEDPTVATVVDGMVGGVNRVMAGDTLKAINDLWRSEGLEDCRETISRRYPFSRSASAAIELDDFGAFFGHGGVMDEFFESTLKDFVNTSNSPWTWKTEMRRASRNSLAQFERAARIRKAYFRRSSGNPQVNFRLSPLEMDRSITNFVLRLGDSVVSYNHGPPQPATFTWPDTDGSDVRIELSPQTPSPAGVAEDGDWAWFRLLERTNMVASSAGDGSYEVTFDVGGRRATFELNPSSSYNPFETSDLTNFSCPERL
ncbi:MAG: type VI secretion system membrane subunit TssM [Gammaproteobacteria bacterium]